jgi:hypothetical protein
MNVKIIAALIALPLLAACAPEIESTVYVQDVLTVAAEQKPLNVPAVLRIPQSSEDSCLKGLPKLIENLRALAPVTGKGKCIEKEGDQLAEIETEMVVTTMGVQFDPKNLFVLETAASDGDGVIALEFRLTRALDEIVKALAANSDELQAEFDPAKFIITVNNDSAGSISLSGNHVFIDGEPHFSEMEPLVLEHRKAIEIVFSDVASEYVSDARPYRLATVAVTAAQ